MEPSNENNIPLGRTNRKFGQRITKDDLSIPPNPHPNILDIETPQQRERRERDEEQAFREYDYDQQKQAQRHAQQAATQQQKSSQHRSAFPVRNEKWYDGLLGLIAWVAVVGGILLIGALLNSLGLMTGNQHGTRWNP